ncbi:MAG: cupin domain-containing protein [Deltaproteobacteria bacterium]|nr:cupin domain-containing protein [Deltaproteobacteria bacterium]
MAEKGAWQRLKGTSQTFYDQWVREVEKVPQVEGLSVADLRAVELAPWPRKGGKGVYVNLGGQRIADAHICEIPPGERHNPEKHMFEEIIFVIKGRGATTVWNEGEPKLTFEWQAGSLFAMPLNSWHQHFNGSGNEPARYVALTDAPLMMNRIRNVDFIFGCDYLFRDRYTYSEDYFSAPGKDYSDAILKTNFIPDLFNTPLVPSPRYRLPFRRFLLANGTLSAHMSVHPVGQYQFGHRHGAGAHIIWLKGTGYDLTWETGTKDIRRIDWRPWTMSSPPDWWYHQHFNTGKEMALKLALHFNIRVSQVGGDFLQYNTPILNEITYDDEDPQLREDFCCELAKNGVAFDMEEIYRLEREYRATREQAVGE